MQHAEESKSRISPVSLEEEPNTFRLDVGEEQAEKTMVETDD